MHTLAANPTPTKCAPIGNLPEARQGQCFPTPHWLCHGFPSCSDPAADSGRRRSSVAPVSFWLRPILEARLGLGFVIGLARLVEFQPLLDLFDLSSGEGLRVFAGLFLPAYGVVEPPGLCVGGGQGADAERVLPFRQFAGVRSELNRARAVQSGIISGIFPARSGGRPRSHDRQVLFSMPMTTRFPKARSALAISLTWVLRETSSSRCAIGYSHLSFWASWRIEMCCSCSSR
jgi:hypothetical protein